MATDKKLEIKTELLRHMETIRIRAANSDPSSKFKMGFLQAQIDISDRMPENIGREFLAFWGLEN